MTGTELSYLLPIRIAEMFFTTVVHPGFPAPREGNCSILFDSKVFKSGHKLLRSHNILSWFSFSLLIEGYGAEAHAQPRGATELYPASSPGALSQRHYPLFVGLPSH